MNINSLDVLNHKRLLDSARADPTAVSFQVRPVDVVSGLDMARRPSFGSLDAHQHYQEVGGGGVRALAVPRLRAARPRARPPACCSRLPPVLPLLSAATASPGAAVP